MITLMAMPLAAVPQPPASVNVSARPGSRLENLLAQRETALARVAEAQAQLDAIVSGIKSELTMAYPKIPEIGIAAGPSGAWPALRLHWATPRVFVLKRFKKEHPGLYEQYREHKGYWELRKAEEGGQ